MTEVYVSFGSNVGDREAHVRAALQSLPALMQVTAVSRTYETEPLYVTDQRPFLNGVVAGRTELGPTALVRALKELEARLGRGASPRNGPREMDLDLVLYGSLRLTSTGSPAVQVPHPRMRERRFVLEPLLEVASPDDPRRESWQHALAGLDSQGCRAVEPHSNLR